MKELHIRFVTLNTRGLQCSSKRQILAQWIRQHKPHVIYLQETHADKQLVQSLQQSYPNSLWTTGPSNSIGVGIIFRIPGIKTSNIYIDPSSRYIFCTIQIDEVTYDILNIYAPSTGKQRPKWIVSLQHLTFNNPAIIAGDFNFTTKIEHRLNNASAGTTGKHEFTSLANKWFIKEPQSKSIFYSWKNSSNSMARLDRFYVSTSLLIETSDYGLFHPFGISDHHPVTISVPRNRIDLGPGFWKFNNTLLSYEPFTEEITQLLMNYSVNNNDDCITAWENTITNIRKIAIKHSKDRARVCKFIMIIYEEIIEMEANYPNSYTTA